MQIRSYSDLIELLTLQKQNLPTYATQVWATAADITAVNNDLANLNAMLAYCEAVDAFKKTDFAIKQALYDGDPAIAMTSRP